MSELTTLKTTQKENAMPDETSRPVRDSRFIALDQDHEFRYWTKNLGCTEGELRAAVVAVGNSVNSVRKYLSILRLRR